MGRNLFTHFFYPQSLVATNSAAINKRLRLRFGRCTGVSIFLVLLPCPPVPAPTSPPTPSVGAEEVGVMELEAWGRREDAPSCLKNVRLLGCRREGLDQAVLGIPVPEGSKLDGTLETLHPVLICLGIRITGALVQIQASPQPCQGPPHSQDSSFPLGATAINRALSSGPWISPN